MSIDRRTLLKMTAKLFGQSPLRPVDLSRRRWREEPMKIGILIPGSEI